MRIDRYTKFVLSVIALALVVIAIRPVVSPPYSHAARSIEYKFLGNLNGGEAELNKMGKQGWDVASDGRNGLIMKR